MKDLNLHQALAAQRALRVALGLPDETFPIAAFIGMLSDEIEQLRAAGKGDAQIAAMIQDSSGAPIDADTIARFYAPPDQRRRG